MRGRLKTFLLLGAMLAPAVTFAASTKIVNTDQTAPVTGADFEPFFDHLADGALIELTLTTGASVRGKLIRFDDENERVWLRVPENDGGHRQQSVRLRGIREARLLQEEPSKKLLKDVEDPKYELINTESR